MRKSRGLRRRWGRWDKRQKKTEYSLLRKGIRSRKPRTRNSYRAKRKY